MKKEKEMRERGPAPLATRLLNLCIFHPSFSVMTLKQSAATFDYKSVGVTRDHGVLTSRHLNAVAGFYSSDGAPLIGTEGPGRDLHA